MNRFDLIDAIGELDPKCYKEADEYRAADRESLLPKAVKYMGAAAAVLILALAVYAVLRHGKIGKDYVKKESPVTTSDGSSEKIAIGDTVMTSVDCEGEFEFYRRYDVGQFSNYQYFEIYHGEELLEKLGVDLQFPAVTDLAYRLSSSDKENRFVFENDRGGKLVVSFFLDGFARKQEYKELKTTESVIRNRKVEIIEKAENGGTPEYMAFFEMGYHGVTFEMSGEEDVNVLVSCLNYMITQAEKHEKEFDEPNTGAADNSSDVDEVCFNVIKK